MHGRSFGPNRPKFSMLRETPLATTTASNRGLASPVRPAIAATVTPTTTTTTTTTAPIQSFPTTSLATSPVASLTAQSAIRRTPPAFRGSHRGVARYGSPVGSPARAPPVVPSVSPSVPVTTTAPVTTTPTTLSQPAVTTAHQTFLLSETGLPSSDWKNVFKDWRAIQPFPTIGTGQPLTPQEIEWMDGRGITFHKRLGSGGFGTVWQVTTDRLLKDDSGNYRQADFACKVVSLSTFYPKPGKVKTFEKAVEEMLIEGDIHHRLSHPNIVKCEEVLYLSHATTGFPLMRTLLFMELMDGDLEGVMIQKFGYRFTSDSEAFSWFWQICDALAYLHDLDTTHFDIKIPNIMYKKVDNQFVYKLSDFGLAHRFVSERIHCKKVGTRTYMPPEMLNVGPGPKQRKEYPAKPADIYCLGMALIESISGVMYRTTMLNALKGKWDQPAVRRWGITQQCVRLIKWMIDETPEDRPTIQQIQQDPWYVQMYANKVN